MRETDGRLQLFLINCETWANALQLIKKKCRPLSRHHVYPAGEKTLRTTRPVDQKIREMYPAGWFSGVFSRRVPAPSLHNKNPAAITNYGKETVRLDF